jgi:hypothetical protein
MLNFNSIILLLLLLLFKILKKTIYFKNISFDYFKKKVEL